MAYRRCFTKKYNWNSSNPINISVLGGGDLKQWISFHSRRAAIFQGTFHTNQITIDTTAYKNLPVNTGLSINDLDAKIIGRGPVSTSPYFALVVYDPTQPQWGDIRYLQTLPELKLASFQIASTFNALEGGRGDSLEKKDTHPNNLIGMLHAAAQGEEAAISCAGATIYRKYFMYPVNLLAGLYPKIRMYEEDGFASIARSTIDYIKRNHVTFEDADRKKIAVGLHEDIVVTSGYGDLRASGHQKQMPVVLQADGITVDINATQIVSQIFTAAYSTRDERRKGPLASEVQDLAKMLLAGSYEGTLKAAFYSGQPKVVLTMMGSGAFQNDVVWVSDALDRPEIKQFIIQQGLQVTFIYRPDKPRTRSELGFDPVRTAERDKEFLLKLFKITDEINGTELAKNPALKNDIANYVDTSYDYGALLGVNRGKKQGIVKALQPQAREERSDVDELSLPEICNKLQCKQKPSGKQISDYNSYSSAIRDKEKEVSPFAQKLQQYFPQPFGSGLTITTKVVAPSDFREKLLDLDRSLKHLQRVLGG